MYKKSQRRTQAARTAYLSGGVMSTRVTVATCQSDHGLWDENFGGNIRPCRARLLPLHAWKASGMSFTGFRPVDDMERNWTSSSCWIAIHQLSVNSAGGRNTWHGLTTANTPRDSRCGSCVRRLCEQEDCCSWYQTGAGPCIYAHSTEPSIGWRHGDDILFAGEREICK